MSITSPAIEAVGISKRYGSLIANDGIDLAVARGEIHAVMGENGAGKSTLMGLLYGLAQPDAGEIRLGGRPVRFRSPSDAIRGGLGMVHQAFKLFESFTVWENIVFGREPRRGLGLDRRAARDSIAALAERYGLAVDPDATVGHLSVGVRQRVEILKALYRGARVLILDEPTAVLTPRERDGLFAVMRALAADGCALLFVTHKLNEVLAVTDTITVLRDGRVSGRMATPDASVDAIVQAMVGRSVAFGPGRAPTPPGAVLLEVDGVDVAPSLKDACLAVRGGEIVGIAGVAGNGQSELVEAIAGLRPVTRGRIVIGGRDMTAQSVRARREAGLAYIPEDRARTGTAPPASAAENLVFGLQRRAPFARRGLLVRAAVRRRARDLIRRFGIRIPDEGRPVATLSGGNLQKVVLAREITHGAAVLLAEQPTRGVDIGAIEAIHRALLEERNKGRAILLVSAELTEILALSDRILVIDRGRLIAELAAAEASEQRIGAWLAGASESSP